MNYGPVLYEHDGPRTVNHIEIVERKPESKTTFVVGMATLTCLVIIAVVVIATMVNYFRQ